MNSFQRVVPITGLLVIAVMGAFPPWVTAPEKHPSATTPAGYHFIASSPEIAPPGTVVWSSKHQRFERDGKPVLQILPFLERGFYQTPVSDSPRFVRIDYERLLIQWAIVVALTLVVVLLIGRRKDGVRTPVGPFNIPVSGPPVTAWSGPLPENIERAINEGVDPSKVTVRRTDPSNKPQGGGP